MQRVIFMNKGDAISNTTPFIDLFINFYPSNYNSHRNRLYDIKARKKKYKVKKNYSMQMSVMKQNNARFNERGNLLF